MSRLRPHRPVRLSHCRERCCGVGPIWLVCGVKSLCCENWSAGAACARLAAPAIARAAHAATPSFVGNQPTFTLTPLGPSDGLKLRPFDVTLIKGLVRAGSTGPGVAGSDACALGAGLWRCGHVIPVWRRLADAIDAAVGAMARARLLGAANAWI